MAINKTILDLATVFVNVSHAETINILDELTEIKRDLELNLAELRSDTTEIEDRLNEIMLIEDQLIYLTYNIRTLQNAILCHEAKIFEKSNLSNGKATYCIN